MDLRNVIFAIALSFAVLFGWSVIFETPQIEQEKKIQNTENNQNSPTPSVNLDLASVKSVSREDAIKSSQRVKFENENVEGSIGNVIGEGRGQLLVGAEGSNADGLRIFVTIGENELSENVLRLFSK